MNRQEVASTWPGWLLLGQYYTSVPCHHATIPPSCHPAIPSSHHTIELVLVRLLHTLLPHSTTRTPHAAISSPGRVLAMASVVLFIVYDTDMVNSPTFDSLLVMAGSWTGVAAGLIPTAALPHFKWREPFQGSP